MNKHLVAEVRIQVPFFDVDPMNIVWHGHYVKYFEIARCALLDKMNYGYHEMAVSGYSWPIIELHVRYAKPARYGQDLICAAKLSEYENRLKIIYEIYNAESGERITKGHTVQVAVSRADNEMQLVSPDAFIKKIAAL